MLCSWIKIWIWKKTYRYIVASRSKRSVLDQIKYIYPWNFEEGFDIILKEFEKLYFVVHYIWLDMNKFLKSFKIPPPPSPHISNSMYPVSLFMTYPLPLHTSYSPLIICTWIVVCYFSKCHMTSLTYKAKTHVSCLIITPPPPHIPLLMKTPVKNLKNMNFF